MAKKTARAPVAKTVTNPEVFIQSTIKTGDRTQRYSVRRDQMELLLRARSDIHICASIVAQYAADVPLKLMADVIPLDRLAHKHGPFTARRIDRRTKSRLRNPTLVGAKAADRMSDEAVEIVNHPVLDLLRCPNPIDTASEFMRSTFYHRLIQGNMYWLVEQERGDNTPPTALERLLPQYVIIQPGEETLIESYRYGREYQIMTEFEPSEIIHQKHAPSPVDPYYGIGCLHAIVEESDILFAALQYELAFYANDSRPGISVKVAPGTTNEQVEAIRSLFRRRHKGPSNAGEPLIAQDLEVDHIDPPLREMQYIEGQKRIQETIRNAFGVPLEIMQSAGGSLAGGDRISSSMLQMQRQTIRPMVNSLCETLNERLLPYYGITDGSMWFCADNPAVEDQTAIELSTRDDANAGVMTIDEARAARGLEPLPDGLGAVPRVNGVPIDTMGQQAANPFGNPFGLPLNFTGPDRATDGAGPDQTAPQNQPAPALPPGIEVPGLPAEFVPEAKSAVLVVAKRQSDYLFDPDYKTCDHGKAFDSARSADGVTQFIDECTKWYQTLSGNIGADGLIAFSVAEAASLFRSFTSDTITAIFSHGYESGASALGKDRPPSLGAFEVHNVTQAAYLDGYKRKLSTLVSQTVSDRIKESVRSLIDEGLPPSAISREIASAMNTNASWMGERIARTESARVYVGGNIKSWQDSGVVHGKKWLAAPDCCAFCNKVSKEFADRHVPLDQPFFKQGHVLHADGESMVLDYSDTDGPPLHPNDRCAVVAVLKPF